MTIKMKIDITFIIIIKFITFLSNYYIINDEDDFDGWAHDEILMIIWLWWQQ